MKFTCTQQTLSKALNIVSKAVSSRTTIPILKGILLEAGANGTVRLAASDLDLSIEKVILLVIFALWNIYLIKLIVYMGRLGDGTSAVGARFRTAFHICTSA